MLKLIETVGNNRNNNILIEAENLDALNELLSEYRGKIDTMIIDPPYNTNIEYINYEDSLFPGGWGHFIQERLKLSKKMMSATGSIFIFIDENELISLLDICHSIFGKQNVNILIWPKTDEKFDENRVEKPVMNVKSSHEYIILCYKNKSKTTFKKMSDGTPMKSIVEGLGTTSSAKDEIAELLGSRTAFSTPKPVNLFKELIKISSSEKSIVLDFFAGSGTAGHAVMKLNAKDGGQRRFILITNDENDICRKVTNIRLKKAIEVYEYDEGYDFFETRA